GEMTMAQRFAYAASLRKDANRLAAAREERHPWWSWIWDPSGMIPGKNEERLRLAADQLENPDYKVVNGEPQLDEELQNARNAAYQAWKELRLTELYTPGGFLTWDDREIETVTGRGNQAVRTPSSVGDWLDPIEFLASFGSGWIMKAPRLFLRPQTIESFLPPGRLGGQVIAKEDMALIIKFLEDKGIKVTFDELKDMMHSVTAAGKSSINLHSKTTWYEFLHEFGHEKAFRELYHGDVKAWQALGTLGREQATYDYLRKYFWDALNLEERRQAIKYLQKVAQETGGVGQYRMSDMLIPYSKGRPSTIRLKKPE